jgi:hypothetical protein
MLSLCDGRLGQRANVDFSSVIVDRHVSMTRGAILLEPATKVVVLASLVLAVVYESWLGRVGWGSLPVVTVSAAIAGLIGGRFAPLPTSALILLFTYISPLVFRLWLGRFSIEHLLVWSAALTGLLLGDRDRWTWAYPARWRLPLIFWALAVAIVWPITALREMDFESLALLERYNIPNTGIGGSPRTVVMWGMDTAIIHLLGLLWFNWLLQHATALSGRAFQKWIAWPMAASAVAGVSLALYQGLFDISFLNVGAFPSLFRAGGSLFDANASGAVAALWSAGLLAFIPGSRIERAAALAGAVACWGGLWMSGSRTALVTAFLPLVAVGISAANRMGLMRRRRVPAIGVAAALLAVVLLLSGTAGGPVQRLKDTLPSEFTREALGSFAREMWNRNGYGAAATTLIQQHPAMGVGIGLFNLSGAALPPWSTMGLPADNAQNWWRHHVAELGFVGAAGLLVWTVVFGVFLISTSADGERQHPAAALKGSLVGLGLISLVGMPTQSLPVAMTFWMFAFWYWRLVQPSWQASGTDALGIGWWTLLIGVVGIYAVAMLVLARGGQRPAVRAAFGAWRYTYGIYDPKIPVPEGLIQRWTERHGVAVVPNDASWMTLAVRAQHPDLQEQPVKVRVSVNGRTVVNRTLNVDMPITCAIDTGTAKRAIIETRVDRTWRPPGIPARHPDVGLSLSWRFGSEKPPGLPVVIAPLSR